MLDQLPSVQAIIYTLDFVGVVACTIAATLLAQQLKFDFFGAVMISFLGSVGGGTLRDLLLNRHPIFWLHDLNYLYWIIGVSVLVQVFYDYFARVDKMLRWFDAVGLAAFTVIGAQAAISRGMSAPIVLLMGAMTAVVGGVLRDIVCRQIPLVLQKEIYITASLLGSMYYLWLPSDWANSWMRSVSTMILIVAIRMLAVYRGWNLPSLTWRPKKAACTLERNVDEH